MESSNPGNILRNGIKNNAEYGRQQAFRHQIRDLGKQLLPIGMLVVLDSIFNRIIRNRSLGKRRAVSSSSCKLRHRTRA